MNFKILKAQMFCDSQQHIQISLSVMFTARCFTIIAVSLERTLGKQGSLARFQIANKQSVHNLLLLLTFDIATNQYIRRTVESTTGCRKKLTCSERKLEEWNWKLTTEFLKHDLYNLKPVLAIRQ